MAYFVYIGVGLSLLLIQTVILPTLFHITNGYDLILIIVLYMGFHRSLPESIPVILIMGLLMDCLSGGPFGIYLTVYGWLFVGVRTTLQFLHADSWIVLPVAVLAGVILENLAVFLAMSFGNSELMFSYESVKIISSQMIWAVFTGPIIFILIKSAHGFYENWFKLSFGPEKDRGDFD